MGRHAVVNGSQSQGTDLDILSDAQDALRIKIGEVPGTGAVLGVWYYEDSVMAFREQDDGYVSMFESTADGWIVRQGGLPTGGRYEFVNYNFGQKTKVYGVSGSHRAFEWDGSSWKWINTGMNPDKPDHVAATGNYLWLSVGSLIENSPVADPTGIWSLRTGANLINTVGDVTALMIEGGNLVAMDRSKIWIHYGTPLQSDERFENLTDKTGAVEWSAQTIGKIRYLDDFGLTDLYRVQQYGDFKHNTFSEAITPFLIAYKDRVKASVAIRKHNEYVLFLDDGRAAVCDFKRNKILGFSVFNFGKVFNCAVSGDDSTKSERVFVGSSDGYVYELEKGPSFDGSNIESWAMLSYHHYGTPRNKKRYRRAALDVDAPEALTLKVRADFDYGNKSSNEITRAVVANTGLWDDDAWNTYSVAMDPASQETFPVYGSAKNMGLSIYHSGKQNTTFRISGLVTDISVRARQRK